MYIYNKKEDNRNSKEHRKVIIQVRKIRKRETCDKSNMAMVKYAVIEQGRYKKGSSTGVQDRP